MSLREALPMIKTTELPGPNAKKVLAKRAEYVPNGVKSMYPVVIENGAGAVVEDPDGNRFIDWVGGVGVLNVGYSHPKVVAAVKAQTEKYIHGMMNIVTHKGYVELAKRLVPHVPVKTADGLKKVFFANSGAEANENAIKIARAYTKRDNIIVFSRAFHGRTLLTVTMTAKRAYSRGMGPLAPGIVRAEYPYAYRAPVSESEMLAYYTQNIKNVFEEGTPADEVAAIILEPLQGEGGFIPAPIEWVRKLREICDQYGILLIADEVQTGFGRTGKFFASCYWQEAGFEPDIIATAKSIAAGVPLSAVIASREIMDGVPNGIVGGTYGGNALACAAGLAVLDVIEEEQLVARSVTIGNQVRETLTALQKKCPLIGEVRGLGGMIGIEFVKDQATREPAPEFVHALILACVAKGLIIENAGVYGNVIRFLAPLVITDEQLAASLAIFTETILELEANEQ